MNAVANAPQIQSPEAPVVAVRPTIEEQITEMIASASKAHPLVDAAVKTLKANKATGEVLRSELATLLRKVEVLKPARFDGKEGRDKFSTDKATRKAQMESWRKADTLCRSAIKRVHLLLQDAGAEQKERFSASVSASGIVTTRCAESLTMRPESHKTARVSI